MREILFRGKRTVNGEWIEGAYSPFNWNFFGEREEKPQIIIISDDKNIDGLWYEVIPETVGQFTGLTDKNGKEAFEGDICRVVYLDRRCDSNGKHYDIENIMIEEVVFEKGAFCFKTTVEDIAFYRPIGFDIYGKQKIKYFEVISNIHDNRNFWRWINDTI